MAKKDKEQEKKVEVESGKTKTENHNKAYINSKGERVMRITEVIKVLAKDQLMTWANMLGFKGIDYKKELERTANIGSMFHGVVEQFMNPKQLAFIDYSAYGVYGFQSEMEATNAIHSFFEWYEDVKNIIKVKFTEKVVVGEKLGGTIDCGIEGFRDPEKVIFVDYKTSPSFYLSQFLQLAGYVKLYEEVYGEDTVEGVMVVLANKKTGTKARARFIDRDAMGPIILCFDCLYNTAVATKILNNSWWQLGKDIQ